MASISSCSRSISTGRVVILMFKVFDPDGLLGLTLVLWQHGASFDLARDRFKGTRDLSMALA